MQQSSLLQMKTSLLKEVLTQPCGMIKASIGLGNTPVGKKAGNMNQNIKKLRLYNEFVWALSKL